MTTIHVVGHGVFDVLKHADIRRNGVLQEALWNIARERQPEKRRHRIFCLCCPGKRFVMEPQVTGSFVDLRRATSDERLDPHARDCPSRGDVVVGARSLADFLTSPSDAVMFRRISRETFSSCYTNAFRCFLQGSNFWAALEEQLFQEFSVSVQSVLHGSEYQLTAGFCERSFIHHGMQTGTLLFEDVTSHRGVRRVRGISLHREHLKAELESCGAWGHVVPTDHLVFALNDSGGVRFIALLPFMRWRNGGCIVASTNEARAVTVSVRSGHIPYSPLLQKHAQELLDRYYGSRAPALRFRNDHLFLSPQKLRITEVRGSAVGKDPYYDALLVDKEKSCSSMTNTEYSEVGPFGNEFQIGRYSSEKLAGASPLVSDESAFALFAASLNILRTTSFAYHCEPRT